MSSFIPTILAELEAFVAGYCRARRLQMSLCGTDVLLETADHRESGVRLAIVQFNGVPLLDWKSWVSSSKRKSCRNTPTTVQFRTFRVRILLIMCGSLPNWLFQKL